MQHFLAILFHNNRDYVQAVWIAGREKKESRRLNNVSTFCPTVSAPPVSSPLSLQQLTFDLHRQSLNPSPSPVLQLWWGHENDESNRATNGAVWLTSLLISMTASLAAAPSSSSSCGCYGNRPMQCYRADRVKCRHLGGFGCDRQNEDEVKTKLQHGGI